MPAADDPYGLITGAKIPGYLEAITAFSEASRLDGETLWGRIAGSKYERRAAEFIMNAFKRWGLEEVRMEDVDARPTWWPLDWELTLLADPAYGEKTANYTFEYAFPSRGSGDTSAQGVEAELVYVGLGREEDLMGRDLQGKIAVVRSFLQPSLFAQTAAGAGRRIAAAGAVGIVTTYDAPGRVQLTGRGIAAESSPGFSLNDEDGKFLIDVIARTGLENPPTARMRLKSEVRDGLKSPNTYGLIRGELDEYVIIPAHTDAYFYGASDTASGVATMLSLAEYYSRKGAPKPRRNLLFAGTAAHHGGSAGVAHLISAYPEVMDKPLTG